MYTAQIIKDRVKEQQQLHKISNSDEMMKELGLGVNIIRQMSDKKGVSCFALATIADKLNCSVDYLLGRVDEPKTTFQNISSSNIINGSNGNNSPLTVNNNDTDDVTKEIVDLVKSLPLVERAKAIIYLNELKTKNPPDSGEE